jgi:hypothetical protein
MQRFFSQKSESRSGEDFRQHGIAREDVAARSQYLPPENAQIRIRRSIHQQSKTYYRLVVGAETFLARRQLFSDFVSNASSRHSRLTRRRSRKNKRLFPVCLKKFPVRSEYRKFPSSSKIEKVADLSRIENRVDQIHPIPS